jgi:hypothetical protein
MHSFLTVVTPPTNRDLTTLATVKDELGIVKSNTDRKLRRWITECSDQIVTYIDRQLARQTATETFRQWPTTTSIWSMINMPSPVDPGWAGGWWHSNPIRLSIRPVESIESVTEDGVVLDPSLYAFDSDSGLVWKLSDDGSGYHVPFGGGHIAVTYIGGYKLPSDPALPSNISRSCLLLMRHRWWGDDKDPMIRQENVPGILETIYVTTAPGDDASMPPEACGLLEAYRHIEVP